MNVIPPGADAPRPLPTALASVLETELADAPVVARLEGIDAPRPLSDDLRARLEAALGAAGGAIPPRLARRLFHEMTRRAVPVPLAVAAVVLLVVGLVSVGLVTANTTPAGGPRSSSRGEMTAPPIGPGEGEASGPGAEATDPVGGATTTAPVAASGTATAPAPAPSGGAGRASAGSARPSSSGGPASAVAGSEARSVRPVRIGVVGAGRGSDVEAGLRGFIEKTNAEGGVGGRRIEVVATGPSSPAADVLAVVNAGDGPLTGASGPPSWVTAPLLEGLHVEEAALRRSVRSFSSTLERQAHVAARSAFPAVAAGARATIYVGSESPWSDRVPAAFERVLRDRQVVTVRVPFDPAAPAFAASDASFISLPPAEVPVFLAAAADAGHAPRSGTWGVASALDERFLDVAARHGSVALASPYLVGGAESDELRTAVGRPVTAATVHGWVTAKALATAVARSQPRTPAAMDDALAALTGWESGFFPPYEVRPGTTARTPEAVVLRVTATGFTSDARFERDPI